MYVCVNIVPTIVLAAVVVCSQVMNLSAEETSR